MRLLHPALLLAALLTLAACDTHDLDPIPGADRTLELHFQAIFAGERAVADINGYRIFDDEVTTNNLLGVAEIAEVNVAGGTQRLRVRVGGYTTEATFEMGDEPVYVLVQYQAPVDDPPVPFIGLQVDVSGERPLYD